MHKQQEKKNQILLIPTDEFNLTTATDEEFEKARQNYNDFLERFAFYTSDNDLKNKKLINYYYPIGVIQ